MNQHNNIKPIYKVIDWESVPIPTLALPSQRELAEWLEKGEVLVWSYPGLSYGTVEKGILNWHSGPDQHALNWKDQLVELRAFNKDKEWRLWRSSGQIKGRKRADSASPPSRSTSPESESYVQAIDTQLKLRGALAVAIKKSMGAVEENTPDLCLMTRNYLGLNGCGMTVYQDVRFIQTEWKGALQ